MYRPRANILIPLLLFSLFFSAMAFVQFASPDLPDNDGYYSLPATQESLRSSKPYDLYADASAWLQENTTAGERVFQTDWDDFPRLFYYNTHNTYLVGLDPTYLQLYDQESYDLWVLITRGEVQQPSQFIANHFESRYVHSDLKHGNFLRQAEQDTGLREVYRDDQAVIFEVVRQAVSH